MKDRYIFKKYISVFHVFVIFAITCSIIYVEFSFDMQRRGNWKIQYEVEYGAKFNSRNILISFNYHKYHWFSCTKVYLRYFLIILLFIRHSVYDQKLTNINFLNIRSIVGNIK